MSGTDLRSPAGLAPVVLTDMEVEDLVWEPVRGMPNVRMKELWRDGESVAGLLRVEPHATEPVHRHPRAHHHMWVVEGSARLLGKVVTVGSYVHVPAGIEHEISEPGPHGCTFFYLFVDHEA